MKHRLIILILITSFAGVGFYASYSYLHCDNFKNLVGSINQSGYEFQHYSCKCRDEKEPLLRKYEIKNLSEVSLPVIWESKDELFIKAPKIAPNEFVTVYKNGFPVKLGESTFSFGINMDEHEENQVATYVKIPLEQKLPTPDTSKWSWNNDELRYPDQESKMAGHFALDNNSNSYLNLYLRSSATREIGDSLFQFRIWMVATDCGPLKILRLNENPSDDNLLYIRWGLMNNPLYFQKFTPRDNSYVIDPDPRTEGYSFNGSSSSISLRHDIPMEILFGNEKLIEFTTL